LGVHENLRGLLGGIMMRRHSVLAVCVVWALAGGACSSDDAESAATTGGVATTAAPEGSPTVPVTAPSTTTSVSSPTPKPHGGVARVYDDHGQVLDTLNPVLEINNFYTSLYQVGLYRIDWDRWEAVPDVVTEFPSLENGGLVENPDGTVTVRLEIRPEAVWEDGVPISGEDFAFTYELLSLPENLQHYGYEYLDPDSLVVGPKSFQFTLTSPGLVWQSLFFVIVPKHDVEGSDFVSDWNDRMWVSGGPFRFEAIEDDHVVFSRNPNYWRTDPETGQRLPYLDRIEIGTFTGEYEEAVLGAAPTELSEAVGRWFDDPRIGVEPGRSPDLEGLTDGEIAAVERLLQQEYLNGLVGGELDVLHRMELLTFPETAEMVAALGDTEGVEGSLLSTIDWEALAFNQGPGRLDVNDDSWNEHLDFRRAVAYALDRDRVAAAVWGSSEPRLDSYVELFSPTLSAGGWDRYPHDPDRARDLLDGLCTELGRDCAEDPPRFVLAPFFHRAHRDAAAAEIVAQLQAVGIDAVAAPEWGWDFLCGGYDVAQVTFGASPDLSVFLDSHGWWTPQGSPTPEGGWNYFRWGTAGVEGVEDDPSTEDFDEAACYNSGPSAVIDEHTERMAELIDEMMRTFDQAALRLLILEVEEILADQVVFIPLYSLPQRSMWNTALGGYRGHLSSSALWYRADL
jgi:ABC-type transport system substrate-binding protein